MSYFTYFDKRKDISEQRILQEKQQKNYYGTTVFKMNKNVKIWIDGASHLFPRKNSGCSVSSFISFHLLFILT